MGVHINPLEPSGNFSCCFKQCYSYESTVNKSALTGKSELVDIRTSSRVHPPSPLSHQWDTGPCKTMREHIVSLEYLPRQEEFGRFEQDSTHSKQKGFDYHANRYFLFRAKHHAGLWSIICVGIDQRCPCPITNGLGKPLVHKCINWDRVKYVRIALQSIKNLKHNGLLIILCIIRKCVILT